MVNFNGHRKAVLVIAGILVLSLSLSSCDSLRSKFTRKKSKAEIESQTVQPVLEPEDYPAPELNPEHNYKENYELILKLDESEQLSTERTVFDLLLVFKKENSLTCRQLRFYPKLTLNGGIS